MKNPITIEQLQDHLNGIEELPHQDLFDPYPHLTTDSSGTISVFTDMETRAYVGKDEVRAVEVYNALTGYSPVPVTAEPTPKPVECVTPSALELVDLLRTINQQAEWGLSGQGDPINMLARVMRLCRESGALCTPPPMTRAENGAAPTTRDWTADEILAREG